MRKVSFFMAMVISALFLVGCQGRTGTMLGMALGGAAGGIVPAVLEDASPAVSTIAPIAGAAIGAGLGLLYDNAQEEEKLQAQQLQAQQEQQMKHAQAQQAQLAELQKSTRLSAPVGVLIGNNSYKVRNGAELAQILIQMPAGSQFGVLVNPKSMKLVSQDMVANGYIQLPGTKMVHGRTLLNFQKPGGQLIPMSVEALAKAI